MNSEFINLLIETNRYFSEIVSEAKMNGFNQYPSISNSIIIIVIILLLNS